MEKVSAKELLRHYESTDLYEGYTSGWAGILPHIIDLPKIDLPKMLPPSASYLDPLK